MKRGSSEEKPCFFVGSSREDLREMPEDVKLGLGKAIRQAQFGGKSSNAKPLVMYKGATVLEIVEDYDSDTYRAVYTVRFAGAIYILHAFQKKSKSGSAMTKHDINLIAQRLKEAQAHHAQRLLEKG